EPSKLDLIRASLGISDADMGGNPRWRRIGADLPAVAPVAPRHARTFVESGSVLQRTRQKRSTLSGIP
ncbi:MAG: hypothetical protein ABI790_15445, partial [Betaproteobacteria bacterium]